ncbi:MAG: type II toxin-antitoxin system HicA family toxin [Acidobacteria bacterium]|nr:type II toxin-antitoxin system HicA family toxin [Acidobacteriota bacterium]
MAERGLPRLDADQVIRVLRRNGFELVSQSGSHQKWRNASSGRQVIVPYHRGRILPLGTMKSIADGSGLP